MSKTILLLDAYNMIHRCRFNWGGGMAEGEYTVIYNFNRLIRATVEEYNPDEIYFVIDGKPKQRLEKFADYKANRKKELTDPEEIAYWENFKRQKREIISMVREKLPLYLVSHPDQEADDLIYYLAKYKASSEDKVIIISSDTDFIQVINELDNVSLYNPVAKKWRQKTPYDYVSWKAMVGDRSDNIPGVRRVGKVTAEKILKNGLLQEKMSDPSFRSSYEASYSLIKLIDLKEIEGEISISKAVFNIENLKSDFERMEFKSILDPSYLSKYDKLLSELN